MAQNIAIPLSKLIAWEGNVRRTESDKGIDELAASIHSHGLLQSLVVRQDKGGNFSVVAGRRRLLALQTLAKKKLLVPDHLVNCQTIDADQDATEISLVENVQREQMHPADEFEAFKVLIDGGTPIADIAARFGVTETVVEKRLKMANVSPKIIKAYRNDQMALQHVMAFAVTTDHEMQEKVWKEVSGSRYLDDPDEIRGMLTQDEIAADDRRVQSVTLAAYEKAGGIVRRDLFSEGDGGTFIADALLLTGLVNKKLEKVAEGVRKEGWKWVETRPQFEYSQWSRCSRVHEEAAPLPPKKQAELDALQKEYNDLVEADYASESEEKNPRIDQLQTKIDKLDDRPKSWRPETLAIAGAVASIGYNGKTAIERGIVKPEDKPKPTKTVKKKQADGSIIEEKVAVPSGHSAVLIESLTNHRTLALAATLKDKPPIALAALVHSMALQLMFDRSSEDLCLCITLKEYYPGELDTEETKAQKALDAAEAKWKKQLPKNAAKLWEWCLKQKQTVLLELMAFCVARSVDAVETKSNKMAGFRLLNSNDIAKAAAFDATKWFETNAENYFSRISKPGIFEALNEAKIKITPAMDKAKKGDLALIAEREIKGTGWLPEILRKPK